MPADAQQGKSQGSNLWGYIGDIDTLSGTTFSHGVAFDPVDGSLVVTDSGKVDWVKNAAGAWVTVQQGTPRVNDYPLSGTNEAAATQYVNDGKFNGSALATTSDSANSGFGSLFVPVTQRSVVPLTDTTLHGPRGVTFTDNGVAWVADTDANVPEGSAEKIIKQYGNPALTPVGGVGHTATWPTRTNPGGVFYPVGTTTTAQGTVLVTSDADGALKEWTADGAFVRSISLTVPAGTAGTADKGSRIPYAVAADRTSGSVYVGVSNFDANKTYDQFLNTAVPFLEKRDANGNLVAMIGAGHFLPGKIVSGVAVEPKTQDVFAWSQGGPIQQFTADGTWVREFTAAEFPGLSDVRGVAFDKGGRMFATVGAGTDQTRVMILGKTPSAAAATTSCVASDSAVNLNWTAPEVGYGQPMIRDYVVEQADKGGTNWKVVPKSAPSLATTRTISGVDDPSKYQWRVTAWNEAGNSDVVPLSAPSSPCLTLKKTVAEKPQSGNGDNVADPGEKLTYSFEVANTSGETADALTIKDTFTKGGSGTLSPVSCPVKSLAPGESTTCTAEYTVSDADGSAGGITNEATASAVMGTSNVVMTAKVASATIKAAPGATPSPTASPTGSPTATPSGSPTATPSGSASASAAPTDVAPSDPAPSEPVPGSPEGETSPESGESDPLASTGLGLSLPAVLAMAGTLMIGAFLISRRARRKG